MLSYAIYIDGKELGIRFHTLHWANKAVADLKGYKLYAQSVIEVRRVHDKPTTAGSVDPRTDVLLGGE